MLSQTESAEINWESQSLRALLFVPGSDVRKLAKVASFGADAVVVDLEDAVADEQKSQARALAFDAIPGCRGDGVVMVRVNGRDTGQLAEDIASVIRPELDAVVVPKVEDAETLTEADRLMEAAEIRAGLPVGSVRLLCLIETARGLVECERILASAPERFLTAILGSGDFSVDLGVDLSRDASELHYARSRLVVAARAARRSRPIDGPFLNLEDHDGLAADTVRSRQLGFQGRIAVYPPQVDAVQRIYLMMPESEIEHVRRIVAEFEEAERRGVASIRVDGEFIDYPLYRRARDKLARDLHQRNAAGATR